jgi:hypothetical protein
LTRNIGEAEFVFFFFSYIWSDSFTLCAVEFLQEPRLSTDETLLFAFFSNINCVSFATDLYLFSSRVIYSLVLLKKYCYQ